MNLIFLLAFLLLLFALRIVEGSDISLRDQKLLSLIFYLTVLCVSLLFGVRTSAYSMLSSFTFGSFFTPTSSKVALAAL